MCDPFILAVGGSVKRSGNDHLLLPGAPPGISTRSSTDSDIASAGHVPHRHRPCRFAYWDLPGARVDGLRVGSGGGEFEGAQPDAVDGGDQVQ